MNYPQLYLQSAVYASITQNKTGNLQNCYAPLHNLITNLGVSDFTTSKLKFNQYLPEDLIITDEYDGSTNIIINDDYNFPRLINSRISIQENNTFLIPEHYGNAVTNVYEEAYLENQFGLFKLYSQIPKLDFLGLEEGMLKCGSYTFYFKLSDADGNLTNIIQHSGIVQVPVGELNSYKIRMGLEDENAGKAVKFKLSNLDMGFDYVRVFYERTTSGSDQATVSEYIMIDQNFPILNGTSEFTITGAEKVIPIVLNDIKTEYADISSAKTQVVAQNILFLGNVNAFVQDYQKLQQLAWRIVPEQIEESPISQDLEYLQTPGGYYQPENVYNYVGYWPDEYYRFGVVFIYNNNQLSPVFNIQGVDLNKNGSNNREYLYNKTDAGYEFQDFEPDNYIFREDIMSNSKGVVKFKSATLNIKNPQLVSVKFNLEALGWDSKGVKQSSVKDVLRSLNIKGLFFVRQKRIPTIIAQGIAIGVTKKENGSLPILKDDSGWRSKSFLNSNRLLTANGSNVLISDSKISINGLLIPDAELQELTFNHIFTSQEFALQKIGNLEITSTSDVFVATSVSNQSDSMRISKLTAIPKDTQIITDGENYFSSLAGNPQEAYKTVDLINDWDNTIPQTLTKSTSLVRGQWGYYVGMSYSGYKFGDIINIRPKGFASNPDLQNRLEFQKRFSDYNLYSPISTRYNSEDVGDTIQCYGGDCFNSVFTHRMMNNFADPELPTNTKIIDPKCWAKNYAVRSTAYIAKKDGLIFNCQKNNEGWYLTSEDYEPSKDSDIPTFHNEIAEMFEIDVMPYDMVGATAEDYKNLKDEIPEDVQKRGYTESADLPFLSEDVIVGQTANGAGNKEKWGFFNKSAFGSLFPFGISFWINLAKWNKYEDGISEEKAFGLIYKKHPEPAKSGMKIVDAYIRLKNSQRSNYVQRGISNINRSDVNAVSFGQWITFPIQSSMNLALRDLDFEHATEEASFNRKRSFYPLEEMNPKIHIPESNCINAAAKKSICTNQQVGFTMVPFIKQEYFNRIYWSKPNVAQNFINSYRMIFKEQFHEYNKEYGSITKLLSLGNALAVIFTHGIGLLEINKNPQSDQEKSPYLASKSVLPTDIQEITADYGSMWKDSILQTPSGIIYGVDTVAKKIWRLAGKQLDFISDQKIGKFLNEFITLSEFDINEYIGHLNVVTHYNEFKHDVIFTFKKDKPKYYIQESILKNLAKTQQDEVKKFIGKETVSEWSIASTEDKAQENPNFTLTLYEASDKNKTTKKLPENNLGEINYIIRSGRIYYNNLDTGYKSDVTWSDGTTWSICYNERMQQFITFYDWYPLLSENINNIFFTFNQEDYDSIYNNVETQKIVKDEFTNDVSITQSDEGSDIGTITIENCDGSFNLSKQYFDPTFSEKSTVYYSYNSLTLTAKPKKTNIWFCGYVGCKDSEIKNVVQIEESEIKYTYTPKDQIENYVFIAIPVNNSEKGITVKLNPEINIADVKLVRLSKEEITKEVDKEQFTYWSLRNSSQNMMYLWKHGQAGLYDNQGEILPTNWYGKQHEFNFEFVVNDEPMRQKIFNNLKILSNKAEPDKFEYEVVGEGYEWFDYKPIVQWINKMSKEDPKSDPDYWWKYVLGKTSEIIQQTYPDFPDFKKQGYWDVDHTRTITKLPYLKMKHTDKKGSPERPAYEWEGNFETYWNKLNPKKDGSHKYGFNSNEVCLVKDDQMNEQRVRSESLGNNVKKYGRIRGNMQYLEDFWNVEIRPIQFKWCYLLSQDPPYTYKTLDIFINDRTGRIHQISSSNTGGGEIILDLTKWDKAQSPILYGTTSSYEHAQIYLNGVLIYTYNDNNAKCTINLVPGQLNVIKFVGRMIFQSIDVESQPLLQNDTLQFKKVETRHRDKYIKVKVRYSGKDLAIIQAIATMYDISYA